MLQVGLHPRDVDRLTVEEFEFIVAAIENTAKAAAVRQQSSAVATMQALGGT